MMFCSNLKLLENAVRLKWVTSLSDMYQISALIIDLIWSTENWLVLFWIWIRSQFSHGAAEAWRPRATAQPPQLLQRALRQNGHHRLPWCLAVSRVLGCGRCGLLRPPAGGAGCMERSPELHTDLQTVWAEPQQTGALRAVPEPPEAGRQRYELHVPSCTAGASVCRLVFSRQTKTRQTKNLFGRRLKLPSEGWDDSVDPTLSVMDFCCFLTQNRTKRFWLRLSVFLY